MSKPLGPYTPVVRAGDWIIVSGQVGAVDGALVEGGVAAQTRQAVANVATQLASVGAELSDVAKTLCFLQDMGDFAVFNDAYVEGFGDHRPARSTIGCGRAAARGARGDRGLGPSGLTSGCGRCCRHRRAPADLPAAGGVGWLRDRRGPRVGAEQRRPGPLRGQRARRAQPLAVSGAPPRRHHRGPHPGHPARTRWSGSAWTRHPSTGRGPRPSCGPWPGTPSPMPGSVGSKPSGCSEMSWRRRASRSTIRRTCRSCRWRPPRPPSCSTSSLAPRRSTAGRGSRVPGRSSPRTRPSAGWPTSPACRRARAGSSSPVARRAT